MLYNTKKKKIKEQTDCPVCECFDKKRKKCNGIGKCCFEWDDKTKTAIDPITKLPIRV